MSSDLERFWAKVDRSAGPEGCWLWTAAIHADGYGRFSQKLADGRWQMIPAHRASLLLHGVVPIRPGLDACHRPTCPRHCVNPAHLRYDTHEANMAERVIVKERMANRLSDSDKEAICVKYASGTPATHLAAEYGVTRQNIHYLVRRGLVTKQQHAAANDNVRVQTGETAWEKRARPR